MSQNTTLDDIASVIGFSLTARLAAHYPGSKVWVPSAVSEHNVLTKLLGISAAKRLANSWPGEFLSIPKMTVVEVENRNAMILAMIADGIAPDAIEAEAGISRRRLNQLKREWQDSGLIDAAIMTAKRRKFAEKMRAENAQKNGGKNAPEKPPGILGLEAARRNIDAAMSEMVQPASKRPGRPTGSVIANRATHAPSDA